MLEDEYDPQIVEILRSVDPDATWTMVELMEGLRVGVTFLLSTISADDERRIQRRMQYVVNEPDVHAGLIRDTENYEAQIRSIVAARLGRPDDELKVRVLVAMAVWGFVSAVLHWVESEFARPLSEVVDTAISVFMAGAESTLN